jgi:hypothetical protein
MAFIIPAVTNNDLLDPTIFGCWSDRRFAAADLPSLYIGFERFFYARA